MEKKDFGSNNSSPITITAPRYTNSNATRDLLDVDDSTRPGGRLDRSQASDSSKRADALTRILAKTNAMSGVSATKIQTLEKQKEQEKREQLGFWAPRRWKAGDVYAPHDLSPMEMLEWRELRRPEKDIVDILGINPLDHYKVCGIYFFVFSRTLCWPYAPACGSGEREDGQISYVPSSSPAD